MDVESPRRAPPNTSHNLKTNASRTPHRHITPSNRECQSLMMGLIFLQTHIHTTRRSFLLVACRGIIGLPPRRADRFGQAAAKNTSCRLVSLHHQTPSRSSRASQVPQRLLRPSASGMNHELASSLEYHTLSEVGHLYWPMSSTSH